MAGLVTVTVTGVELAVRLPEGTQVMTALYWKVLVGEKVNVV